MSQTAHIKMSLLRYASDRAPPHTLTQDKTCYNFCTLYTKCMQTKMIIFIYMCIHKRQWSLSNPGSSLSLQIIEVSAFQGVGLE